MMNVKCLVVTSLVVEQEISHRFNKSKKWKSNPDLALSQHGLPLLEMLQELLKTPNGMRPVVHAKEKFKKKEMAIDVTIARFTLKIVIFGTYAIVKSKMDLER